MCAHKKVTFFSGIYRSDTLAIRNTALHVYCVRDTELLVDLSEEKERTNVHNVHRQAIVLLAINTNNI